MAELFDTIERQQYLELSVGVSRNDRVRRVGTVEYQGHRAVEIRDWVLAAVDRPTKDTAEGEIEFVWHPSSGTIIPFDQVVAIRKALQEIEARHGLVDEDVTV